MTLISLFQNFNQLPVQQPVDQVLGQIQCGAYRQPVEQVRRYLQEGNHPAFEQAKKSLPAFTPSGLFLGGHRLEHLQAYSRLLVLDLDKVPESVLLQAKRAACQSPFTYAAFISPSGNGLKVLVRVSSSAEAHKQAFVQVKAHYEKVLGLRIDESGSDVTRLCFVSWDEDLYLDPAAEEFPVKPMPVVAPDSKVKQSTPTRLQPKINPASPGADEVYRHCVALTERRHRYAEGSRNSFVHQLACNLNRYGLAQEEALGHVMSEFNYEVQEVTASVKSAYAHVQEHGTKQYRQPVTNPAPTKNQTGSKPFPTVSQTGGGGASTQNQPVANQAHPEEEAELGYSSSKEEGLGGSYIDRVEEFLLDRYQFRSNTVTNRQEYRTGSKGKWQPLSDRAESSMLRALKKAQVRVSQAELRMLLDSDFCPLYDPFQVYFQHLPEWDQETDYIDQLAATVTTTDQVQWRFCIKRWLVAMVGGVLDPQVVNHTLIVLSGGQGLGKTTWVLNLVPRPLQDYLYSGEINPGNKDTLQQLSENMLINLDELENLNRSEIGALKEMVTKSEIKVRKAYGRHHEKMIRRASFAGSVNTTQFLNDTTGSRRFLCFEVIGIDYTHQVELEKVYAQALHLYKTGFRFWFDKEEIQLITRSNERFQVLSAEEELLLTWFEKPTDTAPALFLTATQLAAKLSEKAKINVSDASINKLGKALSKHGFARVKRSGVYGYQVRELDWEEVERKSKGASEAPVPPF